MEDELYELGKKKFCVAYTTTVSFLLIVIDMMSHYELNESDVLLHTVSFACCIGVTAMAITHTGLFLKKWYLLIPGISFHCLVIFFTFRTFRGFVVDFANFPSKKLWGLVLAEIVLMSALYVGFVLIKLLGIVSLVICCHEFRQTENEKDSENDRPLSKDDFIEKTKHFHVNIGWSDSFIGITTYHN